MPNTPHGSQLDPTSRDVERLLAKLSGLGSAPVREPAAARAGGGASSSYAASQPRIAVGVARPTGLPSREEHFALWARVLLGVTLAAAMTQWPYQHACDLPLFGYLGAVAAMLLAGGWIAFASWHIRSGPAHVLSLILVYWGIVLAAEQALPRLGYAADAESWRCRAAPSALPAAEHRLAATEGAR